MKKFYIFFLSFLAITLLSTFNPIKSNLKSQDSKKYFLIKNIIVKKNFLIKKNIIKIKLKKIYDKNIFFIKDENIKKPLKEIFFLHKIEVKKKYPDTIIITIFETEPAAILFKNQKKYILDNFSNLIPFSKNYKFENLPIVFGKGAETYFVNFLQLLKKNNFPVTNIVKFSYFKIGRWNLELSDNKIIKLPSDNVKDGITKSIELLNNNEFSNYKIIDLRVDGKIIVE